MDSWAVWLRVLSYNILTVSICFPAVVGFHFGNQSSSNISIQRDHESNVIEFFHFPPITLFFILFSPGLDGGTSSQEREKLITAFNATSNNSVFVFLLSTRWEKNSILRLWNDPPGQDINLISTIIFLFFSTHIRKVFFIVFRVVKTRQNNKEWTC